MSQDSPLYVRVNGRWVLYDRELWNRDPEQKRDDDKDV